MGNVDFFFFLGGDWKFFYEMFNKKNNRNVKKKGRPDRTLILAFVFCYSFLIAVTFDFSLNSFFHVVVLIYTCAFLNKHYPY